MIIRLPLEDLPTVTRLPIKFLRNKANLRLGSVKSFFTAKMFDQCFFRDDEGKYIPNPFDELKLIFPDEFNFRIENSYGSLEADKRPRFGHIDLGLKQDSTGISLGYLDHFIKLPARYMQGVEYGEELVPVIHLDFIGRISKEVFPDKEVIISSVKNIFFECLRRGANLTLITADGFQSANIIQDFNIEGILSDRLSIDSTQTKIYIEEGKIKRISTHNPGAAMDCLWLVVKEKRLGCPYHEWLLKEAPRQEKDDRTKKVHKMPGASDDIIQSVAGTVYNIVENMHMANAMIVEYSEQDLEKLFRKEIQFQENYSDDPMKSFGSSQRTEFHEGASKTGVGDDDLDSDAYEDVDERYGSDFDSFLGHFHE